MDTVIRIEFQDNGQDFTHWDVHPETGKVLDCQPYQYATWCNGRRHVDLGSAVPGGLLSYADGPGGPTVGDIRHPITKVHNVPADWVHRQNAGLPPDRPAPALTHDDDGYDVGNGRTTPTRIQLSRAKGWRMPPNTVKVDRTTRWGNPFAVGMRFRASDADPWSAIFSAEQAVQIYRSFCEHSIGHRFCEDARRELRGKHLACWCKPGQPCHADVLLELANN